MSLLACSHAVFAAENVDQMVDFFRGVFEVEPHFANREFAEFVLPSKFRVAFFRVVGPAAKYFATTGERHHHSFGLTVSDVTALYERSMDRGLQVSGPPKDHPWGEKSFLLIDPEGNRWEIVQSPSKDGMLVNR